MSVRSGSDTEHSSMRLTRLKIIVISKTGSYRGNPCKGAGAPFFTLTGQDFRCISRSSTESVLGQSYVCRKLVLGLTRQYSPSRCPLQELTRLSPRSIWIIFAARQEGRPTQYFCHLYGQVNHALGRVISNSVSQVLSPYVTDTSSEVRWGLHPMD